jgi:hypothetical protein
VVVVVVATITITITITTITMISSSSYSTYYDSVLQIQWLSIQYLLQSKLASEKYIHK